MVNKLSFSASSAGRIDKQLSSFLQVSRSQVSKLVADGRVWVDGHTVNKVSFKVSSEQQIEVLPFEEVGEVGPPQAEDLPLEVLYEDAHIAVINKASGRVVHPGPGHGEHTLVNALLHRFSTLSTLGGEDRPGIVHRLDKGTSGLMVVARTDAAHKHLQDQFRVHSAAREYLAIAFGRNLPVEPVTVDTLIGRHRVHRLRRAVVEEGGKRAITHFTPLAVRGAAALLRCTLQTGRTHQIRVHCVHRGHPIVGDALYGPRRMSYPSWLSPHIDTSVDRPMLHAQKLVFTHPATNERVEFLAEPPEDFSRISFLVSA